MDHFCLSESPWSIVEQLVRNGRSDLSLLRNWCLSRMFRNVDIPLRETLTSLNPPDGSASEAWTKLLNEMEEKFSKRKKEHKSFKNSNTLLI